MLLAEPLSTVLRVERLATDETLDGLRHEWNALCRDVPFRRWEWLQAWWRHYRRPNDEPYVIALRDYAGRLVGLAPWYWRPTALSGNVIRFLGSGKVCSDYLTVLTAEHFEEAVVKGLSHWLMNECDLLWDALELEAVETDDPVVASLVGELAEHGHTVFRDPGPNCWRIALPGEWDDYLRQLSKSRRERVRQLIRRKFDTGAAVVKFVRTETDLDRGLDVLIDLHQRRRADLGQDGCFSSERFTRFLREAAERFLHLGDLRLQWVELDGRPAAVELDLAGGDTIYYYQSGIDPDRSKERPGWLGTSAALRLAIEQGFRGFDFLRGDEEYKSHWRAEPIRTVNYRVAARSTGARLRHEMWVRHRHLKGWVKRGLER